MGMMRKPRFCRPAGTEPPALFGSRDAPTTAITVAASRICRPDLPITTSSHPAGRSIPRLDTQKWLRRGVAPDLLTREPIAARFLSAHVDLAGDSRQPDDRDLAIRLGWVLAVLGRDAGDASQGFFALTPVQRIASDLHPPATHLEPDVVRVLDHVVEPRRMSGGSTL